MDINDIKDAVEKMLDSFNKDDSLLERFKEDPIETIKSVIGVDATISQLREIAKVIEAKLKDAEIADKAKALFDKVKDIFDN